MGYGKSFQDFKVNVHISGRAGPQGIINILQGYPQKQETASQSKTKKMPGDLDQPLNSQTTAPLYLTYTTTGVVKESTSKPPTIDIYV